MTVADRLAPRTGMRVLASALLALLALGIAGIVAPPASAQECDPVYGCSPTTLPGSTPTCSLNAPAEVVGGESVSVFAEGLAAGQSVEVTLDGEVVAAGAADASGNANLSFTVPAGLAQGDHPVFVVGAGVSASCGDLVAGAVQAGVVERPPSGGGSGGGSGGPSVLSNDEQRGGSLARTGTEIGLLLAAAVVLLLVGQRVLAARRRWLRRRNAVPRLEPTSPAQR